MTKDFELTIRVRNNRLLAKMRELGIETAAELARRAGCSQTGVSDVLRMSKPGYGARAPWRPIVQKIADYFGCMPEDIIPEAVRDNPLAKSTARFTSDAIDVKALINSLATLALPADDRLNGEERSAALRVALLTLSPEEERVMRMRYGIGCEARTLDELGDELGCTKERVRLIEMRALKRLQHPARSRPLLRCLPDWETR